MRRAACSLRDCRSSAEKTCVMNEADEVLRFISGRRGGLPAMSELATLLPLETVPRRDLLFSDRVRISSTV